VGGFFQVRQVVVPAVLVVVAPLMEVVLKVVASLVVVLQVVVLKG
jgi:hypothetical protein